MEEYTVPCERSSQSKSPCWLNVLWCTATYQHFWFMKGCIWRRLVSITATCWSHSWRYVTLLPVRRRSAYGGRCSAESLHSKTQFPFWSSDLTLLLPLQLFRNQPAHPHRAGSGSVCVCVCSLLRVFSCVVCYRPLICMSSIGSYINHTVIKATGHTETLPNQCWVNNSLLQIFGIFSFVGQPVHVWVKLKRKWAGSYCCSAAQRSVITMKHNYWLSLGHYFSEKTDSSLTTVIRTWRKPFKRQTEVWIKVEMYLNSQCWYVLHTCAKIHLCSLWHWETWHAI